MTRLLLVRHATNDAHERGVLAGWTPGIHLNAVGREQAQALAKRLATAHVAAIYASPLERTYETAEILAEPHGLSVIANERLGEVRFGAWDGLPLDEMRKQDGFAESQAIPSTARFPEGESFAEVQARIVGELEAIRGRHPEQTVIIVSHSDVLRLAAAFYAGVHLDLFRRFVISPASLTIIEFEAARPRIRCLNDTGHLAPLPGKEAHETTRDD